MLIIEKMIEFVVLCFNALIVKSLFVQGSVPSGLLLCKQFCRVVKSSWSSSTSCYLSATRELLKEAVTMAILRTCLLKDEFIFYILILQLSRSLHCIYWSQNSLKLKYVTPAFNSEWKYENHHSRFPKYIYPGCGHFILLFYWLCLRNVHSRDNTCAQPLFCSLNLLFCVCPVFTWFFTYIVPLWPNQMPTPTILLFNSNLCENTLFDPSFSWQIIKVEVSNIWERCFLQFYKCLKSKHSLFLALQESFSVAKKLTWGIVN